MPLELPLLAAPEDGAIVARLDGETMGTVWQVSAVVAPDRDLTALGAAIQAELDRIIARMSHWEADSDLSRFNRAAAGSRVSLPAELLAVLDIAQSIAAASDGAYDATTGELVDLWGFGPPVSCHDPAFRPPSVDQIEAALGRCGWQRLALDPVTASAVQPGGLRLDLSAIAKGHAVDCVARRLSAEGVINHLVDIGGELRGTGIKPGGQPWWVGLETPPDSAVPLLATSLPAPPLPAASLPAGTPPAETLVALCGLAVATSGDYRRWFAVDGQRRAHTIDPRRGQPLANGVAAVTVLHADCLKADALSTALMVIGVEAGPAWADERDIAARFLVRRPEDAGGLAETTTRAWRAMLQ